MSTHSGSSLFIYYICRVNAVHVATWHEHIDESKKKTIKRAPNGDNTQTRHVIPTSRVLHINPQHPIYVLRKLQLIKDWDCLAWHANRIRSRGIKLKNTINSSSGKTGSLWVMITRHLTLMIEWSNPLCSVLSKGTVTKTTTSKEYEFYHVRNFQHSLCIMTNLFHRVFLFLRRFFKTVCWRRC